ncbi:lytic transglycosylase domain-containing protein [Parvularcula dongshanensis]|uniref:Soluble lytic murein transglycosylase-like protein n=1 Tax=Parvularcula dongshanensis TaxID=1173995 RepID=A0A840I865_9PROT|nr:lytic transglycosylase domain-containing protein [Parvularcula dongshanensis]MBB4660298.1 soluble lytic murein transglycosylase-like protein [Parvularcula dongshanensis]
MTLRPALAALTLACLFPLPAAAETAGESIASILDENDLSLVTPLSEADEERYREIFERQEDGDWKKADALIEALGNPILLGYVLEQRYMHPTAYRSSYPELARWLDAYADHPDAAPIYRLALRRKPAGASPTRPARRRWRTDEAAPLPAELAEDYETNAARQEQVRRIELRLRGMLGRGHAAQAQSYLNAPAQFNALTRPQTDRARGWVAEGLYHQGRLTDARKLATLASDRSPDSALLAHWIAGLTTWRTGDHAGAYPYFARMAVIEEQEPKLRAAGAYWAARAALAAGRANDVEPHLEIAARFPFTLYGQLALGQLGQGSGIDWTPPALTVADYNRLKSMNPRIERAAALRQVGLIREAEDELRWVHAELPKEEDRTLAALTHVLELPTAQLMIALTAGAEREENAPLRAGLYPVPDYAPNGGFEIDRALLFALIRQESKFMTHARSRVGAAGLMQLMPRTAAHVGGDRSLMRSTSRASDKLYEPGYNMQLGQSYVAELLSRHNGGHGDLFEMALSYNWGPGNFRRWQARNPIDDPLLMIESVPNREARGFVDHVMTNLWLYRDRLGEPAPDRDALAGGGLPIYESVEHGGEV